MMAHTMNVQQAMRIIVIVQTVDICSYFFFCTHTKTHLRMYKKFKSGVTNKLFRALFILFYFLLRNCNWLGYTIKTEYTRQDIRVNLRGTDFIHPLKLTLGPVSEKSSAKMALKREDASKKSSSIITLKMPLG